MKLCSHPLSPSVTRGIAAVLLLAAAGSARQISAADVSGRIVTRAVNGTLSSGGQLAIDPNSGCGNGVREGDEECDDGGICIGNTNAGAHCAAASDCPGGRCQPFGGDGCAANCTLESDVAFNLVTGVIQASNIVDPGSSGAVLNGDVITVPLPLSGSQMLTIGKERDGQIPLVIKAAAVHLTRIPVGEGQGCFCPRAVVAKTCGGTVFESDGVTQSLDCTPGFTAGDSVCANKPPCTFVHGPGNSTSGVIGCAGLDGVSVSLTQDSGGSSGMAKAAQLRLTGQGASGSAMLFGTTALGGGVLGFCDAGCRGRSVDQTTTIPGFCTGQDASVYGPDGEFCTDDDPQSQRGSLVAVPMTTGTASGQLLNANVVDGNDIGPFSAIGHPFNCSLVAGGRAFGALASVSVDLARQTQGDVVTTSLLVAAPVPPCVGDCHGDGQVTIDELLAMVNSALAVNAPGVDNTQPAACPRGVASGATVNGALIIQAVNNALNGCGVG